MIKIVLLGYLWKALLSDQTNELISPDNHILVDSSQEILYLLSTNHFLTSNANIPPAP